MKKKSIFVLLEYGRGLAGWKQRYAQGEVSEAVPYGYSAGSTGWAIGFSEDLRENPLTRTVRRVLMRLLGFDIVHVWRNRRQAREADIVWTHTEHAHLAYTFLSIFLRRLPPALCQSVWLPGELEKMLIVRRVFSKWLLRRSDINVMNSKENMKVMRDLVPGAKTAYVAFGISAEPFLNIAPSSFSGSTRLRVLAMGNDRDRDWATLIESARGLVGEVDFRIMTRAAAPDDLPPNVSQEPGRTFRDIRDAYEWSHVVCLPLRHNRHASGITTALEATFARRPLLMTNVGGLDAYLPSLVDYSLSPSASPVDWAEKLSALRTDYRKLSSSMLAAASGDVLDGQLDSEGYSRRLVEQSEALLNSPAIAS